jgi:apolipoprotein N-acyltransferase
MRTLVATAAAGTAYGLAFLDAQWLAATSAILAPLALVALAVAWRTGSASRAALHGLTFGAIAFSIGLAWLFETLHVTGGVPLAIALPVFAAIVLALAASIAGAGALLAWVFASPAARLLAFAPAWWLLEWTRGLPILRFPWLLIGDTQVDALPGALAPVAGVYGVGFAMAAGASALAFGWSRGWRGRSWIAVFVLALAIPPLPRAAGTGADILRVVAIAHPEAHALRDPVAIRDRLDWYRATSEDAMGRADLIVWPESIVPVFAHDLAWYVSKLHRRAAGSATSIVFGVAVADVDGARNAILGVGAANGRYDKRRLVPFAEYVPFARWLGEARTLVELPLGQFGRGHRNDLHVGGRRIAAAICYEAAFPDLVRRNVREAGTPALLAMPGSDAWFADSAGRHQMLRATRMRAMETGLPIVRSATAGDTLVIDANGRVLQRTSPGTPSVGASVVPSTKQSAWVRFGIWPAGLSALLLLFVAGVVEARRK